VTGDGGVELKLVSELVGEIGYELGRRVEIGDGD